MDSVTMLSVGLDYHPGSVQVCVLDAADGRVLANQACADDWRQIAGLAARHGVVRGAAVEACCGSADLAEQLIHHAGWPTALAHPGLVRRMKSGPDKHDTRATPTCWPTSAASATCRRSGSRRRRCASCAGSCASASSWPTAAATSSCASAPRSATCASSRPRARGRAGPSAGSRGPRPSRWTRRRAGSSTSTCWNCGSFKSASRGPSGGWRP